MILAFHVPPLSRGPGKYQKMGSPGKAKLDRRFDFSHFTHTQFNFPVPGLPIFLYFPGPLDSGGT